MTRPPFPPACQHEESPRVGALSSQVQMQAAKGCRISCESTNAQSNVCRTCKSAPSPRLRRHRVGWTPSREDWPAALGMRAVRGRCILAVTWRVMTQKNGPQNQFVYSMTSYVAKGMAARPSPDDPTLPAPTQAGPGSHG